VLVFLGVLQIAGLRGLSATAASGAGSTVQTPGWIPALLSGAELAGSRLNHTSVTMPAVGAAPVPCTAPPAHTAEWRPGVRSWLTHAPAHRFRSSIRRKLHQPKRRQLVKMLRYVDLAVPLWSWCCAPPRLRVPAGALTAHRKRKIASGALRSCCSCCQAPCRIP
jgi:hypothetical protein